MSEFKRARHRLVMQALAALDADFLVRAKCYFGGGTEPGCPVLVLAPVSCFAERIT